MPAGHCGTALSCDSAWGEEPDGIAATLPLTHEEPRAQGYMGVVCDTPVTQVWATAQRCLVASDNKSALVTESEFTVVASGSRNNRHSRRLGSVSLPIQMTQPGQPA